MRVSFRVKEGYDLARVQRQLSEQGLDVTAGKGRQLLAVASQAAIENVLGQSINPKRGSVLAVSGLLDWLGGAVVLDWDPPPA